MCSSRGLAENIEFRSTFDTNFRGFTQTIPKKSYLQKKAEEAHKIFEGLGPKVELVSCGILLVFFFFSFVLFFLLPVALILLC